MVNDSTSPIINVQRSRNAKRYSTIKYSLAIVDTIYLLILLFIFSGSGTSKFLAEKISYLIKINGFIVPTYLLVVYIIYSLLHFPIDIYCSFILEHKFCLSKQTIRDWLKDQFKAGIISYLIAVILFSVFYYVLAHYASIWWLIISLFWVFFSVILTKVTPVIIIPLFFKYKRLSDDTLRTRIMNLANKMKMNPVTNIKSTEAQNKISNGIRQPVSNGVKILDVFEIDFSKKTLKANAAFVGIGRTKRIILSDTLKDRYTYDEIEVILAHEFAHYSSKHLWKLIALNSLLIILAFYLIFKTHHYFLHTFRLSTLLDIASLPVILMYFVIFLIVMQPFQNYVSRRLERNADMMALKATGLKEAFISMMNKLSSQNLADTDPHPLIKIFFFDHPPINERIHMADSLL